MNTKIASEILANLSPEERAHVAKHMVSPGRCGGVHYDKDGIPRYRNGQQAGEPLMNPEEYRQFCERLSRGTDGD